MITLSKEQRLEAYKYALEDVQCHDDQCICISLDDYLIDNHEELWFELDGSSTYSITSFQKWKRR